MTNSIWTNPARKFATNSVARKEAISYIMFVNEYSEENATHYVDSLVVECQQDAIANGKVTNKVFLAHDDNNGWDYYIDTCYYMFTN